MAAKEPKTRTGPAQSMFVGDIYEVSKGVVTVVKYESAIKVTVKFEDGYETATTASDIRKKEVKNPFYRSVAGVGYLGVGNFSYLEHTYAYNKWSYMMNRVYNKKVVEYARYGGRGITVCEEWYNFQNFAEWITTQSNYGKSGYELDKDLIDPKSHIYSKETCCLIPQHINAAITGRRGGINKAKNKFRVRVSLQGKSINVGLYESIDEATSAYKMAKVDFVRRLADQYADVLDLEVYEALKSWSYYEP